MAVVFDAIWNGTPPLNDTLNGTSPFTAGNTITIGSGSNRAVLFLIVTSAVVASTVSSVIWDSGVSNQAASLVSGAAITFNSTRPLRAELWGLKAPVSGNKALAVTLSGTALDFYISAVSFSGVDQTTPFQNGTSSSGGPAVVPSITITTAVGNAVVAVNINDQNSNGTIDHTVVFDDGNGSVSSAFANRAAGASGTVTLGASNTNGFAYAGCDVLAAGASVAAPFFQTDWPISSNWPKYFNSNLWQETGNVELPIPLTPQGQPFSLDVSQFNWPDVRSTGWYKSWEQGGNSLTTVASQVVSQFNWQLPYRSIFPVQTWTYNQTILMGPIQSPFKNYDWPNPLRITWYQNWQEAGNVQLPFPTPFIPFDWPLPKTLTWDRFWSQSPTQQLPKTPFFQSDWPLPKTYQPIQQSWAEAGNVQLPFPTPFFQVVDFPLRPVVQPIDQTWVQNLLETSLFVPMPFNQEDWPNPRAAQQPILIWTNSLPPGVIGVQGVPTSQHDWPLPRTSPPIDQFWFVSTSNLPIPTPPPPPITSAGRYITEAEVRAAISKIASKYGSLGGKARAESLTSNQRTAIASKAASTRWR